MAYYGRKSNTKPRLSGKPCDACGHMPVMRWHKHHDHSTFSIEKHSQNRSKVAPYYANHHKVNRPDLANKMLCPDCYNLLISIPMNKSRL